VKLPATIVGPDPDGGGRGNDLRGNEYGILLVKGHELGRLARNVFAGNDCRECAVPYDSGAGGGGDGRQFTSGNLPESMNSPANPDRVQGDRPPT
jgi:hypothetical protein